LVKRLLERGDLNLVESVSATTRAPRAGERDGVDYYFLSREAFGQWVAEGRLLEWAEVHGNWYGTPRAAVEEQLAAGRVVLLEIDVQGAAAVRRADPTAYLVFLAPPSLDELEHRLRGRQSESAEELELRLAGARAELAAAGSYDEIVVNDDLDETIERMAGIIRRLEGSERPCMKS
jgi:guanylate kinase